MMEACSEALVGLTERMGIPAGPFPALVPLGESDIWTRSTPNDDCTKVIRFLLLSHRDKA